MARKKTLISLPLNLTELNERIALYSKLQRDLSVEEAARDGEIAFIKARYAPMLAQIAEGIVREQSAIETYANANRSSLLVGEAKSTSLAAGRIGWRLGGWRVALAKNSAERALAFVKSVRGLRKKYLRVVFELNKEAMLADRPEVDGASYKQDESFFIEPNAATQKVEAIGEAIMVTR